MTHRGLLCGLVAGSAGCGSLSRRPRRRLDGGGRAGAHRAEVLPPRLLHLQLCALRPEQQKAPDFNIALGRAGRSLVFKM